MNLLDDPSMKEIIDDFCQESSELFVQLEASLSELENDPHNTKQLEIFGQIIDRVMGSSKTLGMEEMATFCELGKTIGYKAGQVKDPVLLNVVVAVLYDAIDILKKMLEEVRTGNSKCLEALNIEAFKDRLRWLSEKFKHIERASCRVGIDESKNLTQNSIDELMASLGL